MAKLVGDHVCLREVSRRREALAQLVEERQVEIDLLVLRTVERAGCRLGVAARRSDRVSKQDQLRVAITAAEGRVPCRLGILDNEGDELHLAVLRRRLLDGPGDARLVRGGRGVIEEGEEVPAEKQTQNQQNDRTADSDRRAAKSESTRSSAILDVIAFASGRPAHERKRSTIKAN